MGPVYAWVLHSQIPPTTDTVGWPYPTILLKSLSICGYWYLMGVLESIPHRHRVSSVLFYLVWWMSFRKLMFRHFKERTIRQCLSFYTKHGSPFLFTLQDGRLGVPSLQPLPLSAVLTYWASAVLVLTEMTPGRAATQPEFTLPGSPSPFPSSHNKGLCFCVVWFRVAWVCHQVRRADLRNSLIPGWDAHGRDLNPTAAYENIWVRTVSPHCYKVSVFV